MRTTFDALGDHPDIRTTDAELWRAEGSTARITPQIMIPEHDRRFEDLLATASVYLTDLDGPRLRRAYEYARHHHEGQTRSSGEPYIGHPVEVAMIVADLHGDQPSIEAALLHDTVEDTAATAEEVDQLFGREVAELVLSLTKISKLKFRTREEAQAENIRRLIVAMGRDVRVILVKLADRVHNMATLEHKDEAGRRRIALETVEIYAPIANRLGIHKIKVKLEDESFRYLDPEAYAMLRERVQKTRGDRDAYVRDTIDRLETLLRENDIEGEVRGRSKHFYSIYQKMQREGLEYDQLFDTTAFRVILAEKHRSYEVLGYVHQMWPPVAGRFKDYIAVPKANGYQSIHTTVVGPGGERIEVQIRDREMHQFAEFGVAAHWLYKERRRLDASSVDFTALRELVQTQTSAPEGKAYLDDLRHSLFSDEVYVFTPQRDIKRLPRGSTPLDFAYAIHSEVGDHCQHARVNGRHVPLRYELANGDVVEITTRSDQHPHESWLEMVRSPRARDKIRQYIGQEKKDKARALAKDLLTSEFARQGRRFESVEKSGDLAQAAEQMKFQNVEQLMLAVGYGKLQATSVVARVMPPAPAPASAASSTSPVADIAAPARVFGAPVRDLTLPTSSRAGVRVDGVDGDIMVAYARCCNPVPGEEISGYVTRGRGIVVHTRACSRMGDLEPERVVELDWGTVACEGSSDTRRRVCVRIVCRDEPGLLAKMSLAFTEAGVNIVQAHCRARNDGKATNLFDVMVTNVRQLKDATRNLKAIDGVMQVERVHA